MPCIRSMLRLVYEHYVCLSVCNVGGLWSTVQQKVGLWQDWSVSWLPLPCHTLPRHARLLEPTRIVFCDPEFYLQRPVRYENVWVLHFGDKNLHVARLSCRAISARAEFLVQSVLLFVIVTDLQAEPKQQRTRVRRPLLDWQPEHAGQEQRRQVAIII